MNGKVAPCGTYNGYARHLRAGTEVCEPCARASCDYSNVRRAKLGMTQGSLVPHTVLARLLNNVEPSIRDWAENELKDYPGTAAIVAAIRTGELDEARRPGSTTTAKPQSLITLEETTAVRAHVRQLRDAGLSTLRIATDAGLSALTVKKLLADRRGRRRVRQETASGLLSVQAPDVTIKLRALVAIGWPCRRLAARADITTATLYRHVRTTNNPTLKTTERKIYDLYSQLCGSPPTPDEVPPHIAATTIRAARKRGWAPPPGWNDDVLHGLGLLEPDTEEIDEVVVDRLVSDTPVKANYTERRAAAIRLARQGERRRAMMLLSCTSARLDTLLRESLENNPAVEPETAT